MARKTRKTSRILLIPFMFMLLLGAVFAFAPGTVEESFAETPATAPIGVAGAGTALGANDCVISYTLDTVGGYTIDSIDCPPEGFPETVTADMTLDEKAHILLPEFEEVITPKG